MKKFKDYFQDKIEKEPSWASTIKKVKRKKSDLEGDPTEEKSKDHQSTEHLGDGESINLT